ncbi:alpha/beta hydrolase [Catellatospora sp. IY07-71]|uniref:alpha/beta hydrolase n=1 Tax=Catellatospora sp. IY07-71 TaxID=2728827 RepID=UPI001BB2F395|nr:alpha/beta fold hydrolase [Catellatospora sp. IY07-71]BCJ74638.1 alpha/beta hydrolase [Catellatospora sp. IY07-71]
MLKASSVIRPALIVLLIAVLLVTALWLLQRRLIYLPDTSPPGPAAAALPGARDVTLRTADGLDLGAWLVPPAGPDRGLAVLVANGNGGNRAGRASVAAELAERGFTVLLFDYRGYGGNPGSPSEQGLAEDVRAAYRYLVDGAGVRPDRLIYFGESLGGAVVTGLAAEHPPAGLLLRSPFTDLAATAATHYPFLPVRAMLRDRFPVAELITRIDVPTAVVYGTADSVVPADQSRAVAAAAAGPVEVTVVEGADHNDAVLFEGDQVMDAVVRLADRIAAGR